MISVIVIAKNGAGVIGRTLDALVSQREAHADEILVLDSGSRDETVSIARGYGVRLSEIPAQEFGHGATRNYGAALARGDLLVFLNADAVPAGPLWLAALRRAYDGCPGIAGAYSRVVPPPGLNPLDARDILQDRYLFGCPRKRLAAGESLDALAPEALRRRAAFHTISCMIAKRTLQQHPFAAVEFGEDLEWGARMLARGYALCCAADSVVVHGHEFHRSFARTVQRYYDDACCNRALVRRYPPRRWLLQPAVWAHTVLRDWQYLVENRCPGGWRWMILSPVMRAAERIAFVLALLPLPKAWRQRLSLVYLIKHS